MLNLSGLCKNSKFLCQCQSSQLHQKLQEIQENSQIFCHSGNFKMFTPVINTFRKQKNQQRYRRIQQHNWEKRY